MGTSANNQANARADWEERIDQRSQVQAQVEGTTHRAPSLPPPGSLMVESGADQVTLHWQLIYNAVGYLIHRSESQGGPFTLIDHGGGDLLAVPGPIYADTTAEPGTRYWYAVASLADAKSTAGELSAPVEAIPKADAAVPLALSVQAQTSSRQLHAVWHMLGSEHLSQLFYGEGAGGSHTGKEFQEALRMTRTELGAEYMRAHAILHDEQGVYREVEGEARYDFTAIERIYDRLLELGLRPIIELSFLPHDLASDPTATVFTYNGIISPPRDWKRWGELNRNLAAHLVERYGIDEVRQWSFEIWNELNLKVFWTRTQDEYFRLYDIAARAIKSVDDRLQVGGPSTAAAEWITDFLNFVRQQDSPLDFISTHSYGNLPLDRRSCASESPSQYVHRAIS